MTITRRHREMIANNCTSDQLKEVSIEKGMITLSQNVRLRVLEGLTTLDEMMKISYSND